MTNRKVLITIAIISALLLVSAIDNYYFKINKSFEIFGALFREITDNYVEEIDPEKLAEDSFDGMLSNLDPYSVFYKDDEGEDIDLLTSGTYTGLGITVSMRDSMITIVDVRDDFPAKRVGIRIGDRIYKIDSTVVLNISTEELRQYTRGATGSELSVYVLRDGIKDTLRFDMTRQEIKVKDVSYSEMLDDGVAYVKLERFTRNSTHELRQALNYLSYANNLRGLILDLRDNPGGLLEAAVSISEIFVPRGSVIVSTKGRKRQSSFTYRSNNDPDYPDLPLVVLINGRSASASEIVAGAIQDLDRGIIVGERSFGKGLVQTVVNLPYKTNLKLTTARYYTPSGRCIQRLEYNGLKNERDRDSDSSVFYTKNGRPVTEYFGILPDTIVHEYELPDFVSKLEKKYLFFNFANLFTAEKDSLDASCYNKKMVFSEFKKYLATGDITVDTELESYLDSINELASRNDFSGSALKSLEKTGSLLRKEENKLVDKYKVEIAAQLMKEIYRRFADDEQKIEIELDDNDIIAAKSLLDSGNYKTILARETENSNKIR